MTERAGPPRNLVPNTPLPGVNGNVKIEVESEKPIRGDEDTKETAMARTEKRKKMVAQTHLGNVKLTEVTNSIFATLSKGEICRYGTTGWILRCPQCGGLIIMEDDTHKTYVTPDNSHYRLHPSLVCPNDKCSWHVFAVVVPESVDGDTKIEVEIEDDDDDDDDPYNLAGAIVL